MRNLESRIFTPAYIRDLDDYNNIKEYYLNTFPTDDLGAEINNTATFTGLKLVLLNYMDVYDYLGTYDSLIRERVFEQLGELYGLTYNQVYSDWIELV